MRPMYCLMTLGLVALGSAQIIEERSSIINPDGSKTLNQRSSFSQSTFSEEATGPDGTTVGRTVNRDSAGKITGNEWTSKDGKKISNKPVDGSGIGGRSTLTGLGGNFGTLGSDFGGLGSGNLGAGGLGTTGFGPGGIGSTGLGGIHTTGIGAGGLGTTGFGTGFNNPGLGNIGNTNAGYGGFPNSGLPWANFNMFGNPYGGQQFFMPQQTQFPTQFNIADFGFQQPLMVPNYSRFLLGGVGSNPNIANDGQFANIVPKFGIGSNFGGVGFNSGFGNPGFTQRSSKQDYDPSTGRQTYSYSESSGHQSSTNTQR